MRLVGGFRNVIAVDAPMTGTLDSKPSKKVAGTTFEAKSIARLDRATTRAVDGNCGYIAYFLPACRFGAWSYACRPLNHLGARQRGIS